MTRLADAAMFVLSVLAAFAVVAFQAPQIINVETLDIDAASLEAEASR